MASIMALPVFADVSDGYVRTRAAYGEKAEEYTTQITLDNGETVNVVRCDAEEVALHTETNVRENPTVESERITTLKADCRVKAWGYTDNGWCRVFCLDNENNRWYGFIKGDLLDLVTENQLETVVPPVNVIEEGL